MTIDNKKNVYRIWLSKLISTLIFTVIIIVIMFLDHFDSTTSVLSKYHIVIGISVIFIIISIIGILRNPYYFYFDDTTEVLIIRYYPIGILNSKKHSAQIPKQHFLKFETEKFFFGREEKIIVYQLYRKKIAKYPPISLSAVDKKDREKLILTLEAYSRKN